MGIIGATSLNIGSTCFGCAQSTLKLAETSEDGDEKSQIMVCQYREETTNEAK
jgi:hypothetical protein